MSISARAALSAVAPYSRPRTAPVDLSDNTNRWGTAPSAIEVLRSVDPTRYPEPYADSLKAAIATHFGVRVEQVTTGCGSAGVLDAAIRAYGEPGSRIAIPEPTFPVPATFARILGVAPVLLALDERYQPDPDAIAAVRPALVYLCSPNNPLGTAISEEFVVEIALRTAGLVIVDEAYADFSGVSLLPLLSRCPNLLLVRTMSKAFGLAGTRVGFALGAPEVVANIERARGPYTVSAHGAASAIAAFTRDILWMADRVHDAVTARGRLEEELRSRGLAPVPSVANFVLVPMARARAVAASMATRGVAVRAFTGLRAVCPALRATQGDALRITVAPPAEVDAMLDALDAAMEAACW